MPPLFLNRRAFLASTTCAAGAVLAGCPSLTQHRLGPSPARHFGDASVLPVGNAPPPPPLPHFPDRVHAFVWRNWCLVPPDRMASVLGTTTPQVLLVGRAMGLSNPPRISGDQWRRSYITIIKRNWHLLPYGQLLELLGWTPEKLAYTLREDDFLWIKLGSYKPNCTPIQLSEAESPSSREEAWNIARVMAEEMPSGARTSTEPLFGFLKELNAPAHGDLTASGVSTLSPRFCYSYHALYGDPLLETETDPYPEGYLAKLAEAGADGVWLQAVLYKLAPFPWEPGLSDRHQERLASLRRLVARAARRGMRIWLYLNEPRAMPLWFFESRPTLQGVTEGDHATLCTSQLEVREYLSTSITAICRAVPGLGGFFTITASENLTNCWSHGAGAACPRCKARGAAAVIAEVNEAIWEGIRSAGTVESKPLPGLIAWDWGWSDAWAEDCVNRLPAGVALMSVSEWSLPIERGGVKSTVGEYSISAVGPGPRARKHWSAARRRGLRCIAKIQAGNTWELAAVPYIPAVASVARHAEGLRGTQVDGLMLGWTLGGYPSPNLEVVATLGIDPNCDAQQAMLRVAERRFGKDLAPAVVQAWQRISAAFSEFPYSGGTVYSAPLQTGPANLLWAITTGCKASMVGFPYDDLDAWRSIYPPDIFAAQLEKVATGFSQAITELHAVVSSAILTKAQTKAIQSELTVAEAASIHFQSVANQTRFVMARRTLPGKPGEPAARQTLDALEFLVRNELALARRLHALQGSDSRLGFEASNHYFYVPMDLAEKVINCRWLLDKWLPAQRASLKRTPTTG
jgi:hypothetical protein